MQKLLTIIIACIGVNAALSTDGGYCKPTLTDYVVKYDDLPWVEGSFNPISPHYYGLSYITFQVDQFDGFIQPASAKQYAMTFGGSGNITIPDSTPKQSFDLHSFSYACNSGVPQPECAISMWGWKESGKVIHRTLNFPRLDPGYEPKDFVMNRTRFGYDWSDLKSVGFSIARGDNGENIYGGLMIDDLSYTIKDESGC
ncbi:hypothetical protein EJ08DRAFT_654459 [Tothia fuscella]|uniref:Uncharacterized protein n=1 Tax=Tothia fuscella TaxID=1048955 RepID=A0A9P4TSM2_9PEZI|nr:hypothetical protein EJ08DRAFT_654459 [Tothia fuscella]